MAPKIAERSPKRSHDGYHGAKIRQDGAQEANKCSEDGDLGFILGAFGIDFLLFLILCGCQAAYFEAMKNLRFFNVFRWFGVQNGSQIQENPGKMAMLIPSWAVFGDLGC